MFQCSATFIIKAHDLKSDGKPTKTELSQAEAYMDKFDAVSAQAIASFERNRRTRKEASDYLQQHVDTMSGIFAEDPTVMRRFLRICDKRFPTDASIRNPAENR